MTTWHRVKDGDLPKLGSEVIGAFRGQFNWVRFPAQMTLHHGLYASGYASPTHWAEWPDFPEEE